MGPSRGPSGHLGAIWGIFLYIDLSFWAYMVMASSSESRVEQESSSDEQSKNPQDAGEDELHEESKSENRVLQIKLAPVSAHSFAVGGSVAKPSAAEKAAAKAVEKAKMGAWKLAGKKWRADEEFKQKFGYAKHVDATVQRTLGFLETGPASQSLSSGSSGDAVTTEVASAVVEPVILVEVLEPSDPLTDAVRTFRGMLLQYMMDDTARARPDFGVMRARLSSPHRAALEAASPGDLQAKLEDTSSDSALISVMARSRVAIELAGRRAGMEAAAVGGCVEEAMVKAEKATRSAWTPAVMDELGAKDDLEKAVVAERRRLENIEYQKKGVKAAKKYREAKARKRARLLSPFDGHTVSGAAVKRQRVRVRKAAPKPAGVLVGATVKVAETVASSSVAVAVAASSVDVAGAASAVDVAVAASSVDVAVAASAVDVETVAASSVDVAVAASSSFVVEAVASGSDAHP
jgi:hypothetical protein